MRTSVGQRILTYVLAGVAGAIFGVAGTIGHAFLAGPVPVGLAVALIACGALLVSLRLLVRDRWATWAAGIGMIVLLLLYSGRGPGGSVVVPQAAEGEFPLGIVWTYALAAAVLLVGAWPDLSHLRAGAQTAQDRTRRIDP